MTVATIETTHKGGGAYGATHDRDCPACVAEAAASKAAHQASNPHRPGTKVWAARERMDRSAEWACDLRGETYWSM